MEAKPLWLVEVNVVRMTLILASLVVALSAGPALPASPADKSIVPGTRIGPWTLQMTIDEFVAQLGRPTRIMSASQLGADIQSDLRAHNWNSVGLLVYTRDGQHALLMEINQAPEYVTEKGVRWDTLRADVETAYGPPTKVSQWGLSNLNLLYDGIGLEVYLSQVARVQGLGVFRPGTASSIWKL